MTLRLQEIKDRNTIFSSVIYLSKLNYNGGDPGIIQPKYMANSNTINNSIDSPMRTDKALNVRLPVFWLNSK